MNTMAFIDGILLRRYLIELGWILDFKKLLELFKEDRQFVRPIYYNVVPNDPTVYSPVVRLATWLAANGYSVCTLLKLDHGMANYTTNLVVDALEASQNCSTMVFVGVDPYHIPLFMALRRKGVRIIAIAKRPADYTSLAPSLRRHIDQVFYIEDLQHQLENSYRATSEDEASDQPDIEE